MTVQGRVEGCRCAGRLPHYKNVSRGSINGLSNQRSCGSRYQFFELNQPLTQVILYRVGAAPSG